MCQVTTTSFTVQLIERYSNQSIVAKPTNDAFALPFKMIISLVHGQKKSRVTTFNCNAGEREKLPTNKKKICIFPPATAQQADDSLFLSVERQFYANELQRQMKVKQQNAFKTAEKKTIRTYENSHKVQLL